MKTTPFSLPTALFRFGLALVAGALVWHSSPLRADPSVAADPLAPAWKLTDLDGHLVTSQQFAGKVVVVDFWATWCPPCVEEIPGYIELQKKYGDSGLVIVGVSMDQKGPAHVQKWAKAKGMNYQIVMADENIADAFGGFDVIPTTFLINRAGRIVHRKSGAMAPEEYEKLVKQALNAN
jgi:thiol-disulfide isomerase/thioredoxin